MTTDFFDREARAEKQTRRLVWLFGFTVLGVLIVNNLLLDSIIYIFRSPRGGITGFPINIFVTALYLFGEALVYPLHFLKLIGQPVVVVGVSLGTLLSIAAGSFYKIWQLSKGGSVIAELLNGRRIVAGTTDADEQRLRHVVAEMAIAAGTTVPEIYILDNERGLNSFAAGHSRDDIAIGVTRGCVKLLTRDELQGVIAHEFSHILNGDTRLNMKLIGLAHGFFWPTILGRVLTYGTTEANVTDSFILVQDDAVKILATAPLGFLFILLGSISLPFVRLIKGAICRQREWLADAAAIQFTRNPAGLGGALKKIGGLFKQGRLDSPHAEVASHLYFVESDYEPWLRFLATHPPLFRRVSAIDPAFDGNFPKVTMLAPNQYERDQAFEKVIGNAIAMDRFGAENAQLMSGTAEHLRQVSLMRFNLPPTVKLALGNPTGAAGIVFSLLLSSDDAVRARQMEILRVNLAPETFGQITSLAPQITALGDRYKLFLAGFAVPVLREYNLNEHDAFHQTLQQLIECDGAVDLFEFMLMKMVARQLRAHFNGPETGRTQYGRVQDFLPECALLLSALAYIGREDETAARKAFAQGVEFLDAPNAKIQFLPRTEWDLSKVDAALSRLASHHEALKKNILMACGKTVTASDDVNERDAELLRAIADSLDCPMPSFVETVLYEELVKDASAVP